MKDEVIQLYQDCENLLVHQSDESTKVENMNYLASSTFENVLKLFRNTIQKTRLRKNYSDTYSEQLFRNTIHNNRPEKQYSETIIPKNYSGQLFKK